MKAAKAAEAGAMPKPTLAQAIYRYRASWNEFLADSIDDDKLCWKPTTLDVLARWQTPAENWSEACEALKLAIEQKEAGDCPTVMPLMRAAYAFISENPSRRPSTEEQV